ncbi:MAG: F0F1 ATP synthase subunit B [Gemmatimonadota bacterium]|nr:F0F1 ATP synthase subunit B [Gemmatimonadota bacterium]
MRTAFPMSLLLALASVPAAAQEHGPAASGDLLSLNGGLMFWTLIVFLLLLVVLSKYAFKPITAAVAEREAMLQRALDEAKRDRDEAAKSLTEQRQAIENARAEAQRYIAEGRAAGEKMRADMMALTRQEQQETMDRARREIGAERDRAIADLRKEAVDLAIRGASKVIEKDLDEPTNRRLVENFLGSLSTGGKTRN